RRLARLLCAADRHARARAMAGFPGAALSPHRAVERRLPHRVAILRRRGRARSPAGDDAGPDRLAAIRTPVARAGTHRPPLLPFAADHGGDRGSLRNGSATGPWPSPRPSGKSGTPPP